MNEFYLNAYEESFYAGYELHCLYGDDGDLLYCQPDGDAAITSPFTAQELADAALPWDLARKLIPDLSIPF